MLVVCRRRRGGRIRGRRGDARRPEAVAAGAVAAAAPGGGRPLRAPAAVAAACGAARHRRWVLTSAQHWLCIWQSQSSGTQQLRFCPLHTVSSLNAVVCEGHGDGMAFGLTSLVTTCKGFLLAAVEQLATLFAGSPDTADDRLDATASACTGGDCMADPLQTLRALRFAIFAVDAALREALHSSADSASSSGGSAAESGAGSSNGAGPAAPVADTRHTRGLQLVAHLEVLLTDAAGHVVAEVDRARDVGLLDGGTISVAIALIGEEALWLGMCCQVRICTRPASAGQPCHFQP